MKNILKSFYQRYNNNYQQEYIINKEFEYLKNCKKILDVGCGEGDFIRLNPRKIIGIDSNSDSVKICKKSKFVVTKANAIKIPFKNNSFDGLHAAHIIEHLEVKDAYKFLVEAGRLLKKNGILVISTPILWSGFYDDFTHQKPYYPNSLRRYLVQDNNNRTFNSPQFSFNEVDFYWRYENLPSFGKVTYLLSNYLYQYNIHSFKKNGYTIAFKKK